MRRCLFCRENGNFHTREHIIPESLGNDTDILVSVICDSCQNYFGREVEKPALEKTNIAFWRSYLGIQTKRKHFPSVNLDPPAKGALPAFHPIADMGVGFTAHDDGTTSIDVDNPKFMDRLLSSDEPKYLMVLSPWHLSILGRFLGKMGLEYVALVNLDDALSVRYDGIRSFVRYGSMSHLWPIYWGQQGKLEDLKSSTVCKGSEWEQEIECYRYGLGEMKNSEMIFAFSIGIDLMVICLTNSLPIPDVETCIAGIKLSCIHYPDGTW